MDDRKPQRTEGYQEKDLGDEVVLYDPSGKEIHILNRTAYAVWSMCDGEHTLTDMESSVRGSFDLPKNGVNVVADIQAVLGTLQEKGLLLE